MSDYDDDDGGLFAFVVAAFLIMCIIAIAVAVVAGAAVVGIGKGGYNGLKGYYQSLHEVYGSREITSRWAHGKGHATGTAIGVSLTVLWVVAILLIAYFVSA